MKTPRRWPIIRRLDQFRARGPNCSPERDIERSADGSPETSSSLAVQDVQDAIAVHRRDGEAAKQYCDWLVGVARWTGVPVVVSSSIPKV